MLSWSCRVWAESFGNLLNHTTDVQGDRSLRTTLILILLGSLLACPAPARSLDTPMVFQVFGGVPLNVQTRLTVNQDGHDTLKHNASWKSRPFEQPLYWALRLRWQRDHHGLELQLLHHKLYLANNPPEIEHFEVTHGFNILTVSYVAWTDPVQLRVGLGAVLPSSDSTVRGLSHDAHDYKLAGPALQIGAGWEKDLSRHLMVAAEGQFIYAWADVDIADGQARVRSVALHLLFGLGVGF